MSAPAGRAPSAHRSPAAAGTEAAQPQGPAATAPVASDGWPLQLGPWPG